MGERLNGQVALVTGGSRGIGLAICQALLEQGATIAAGYSRDEASANALVATAPDRISAHQGNIGAVADCQRVVAEVLDRHGRIDILVNNAGITRDQLMLRMKRDDWDQVIATNLTSAFVCSQAVLKPMLKQRSGRIVNISSVVGQAGNAGQANYAASKAGLIGFSKALARELASRSITVNVVAPGLIETDMTKALTE